ncbi:MAG: hypothetical protein QMD17_05060 [Rhodocyclaceae bacterium]|jgi:hypothetical protein|nr:hypothetical protein [Rhodocyclaceae bacterium]MDO9602081.1 hypothetical protein [Rhodocyclaceae bacterium]MDP2195675.1 hypothetical protein [Rhodocyclaceae bacterium]
MNSQLKQRIDAKLERLNEQCVAEVLDFVEFLESRQRTAEPMTGGVPMIERLGQPFLDTRGFKFDREEANAR